MHSYKRNLQNTKHLYSEEDIYSEKKLVDNKKQAFEILLDI